ncbi:glycosyltransferase [Luminiphilus sp.]|nr:glycosyltransferase [Luminiphilus sp.]
MPGVARTWCSVDDLQHPHEFFSSFRTSPYDGGIAPRLSPRLWLEILLSDAQDTLIFQGFSNVDEIICLVLSRFTPAKVAFRGEGMKKNGEKMWVHHLKRWLLRPVNYLLYSTIDNQEYMAQYAPSNAKVFHYPTVSNIFVTREQTDKSKIVVISSRLTQRKRIDLCLEFFARAFPREYKLKVYGDGTDSDVKAIKTLALSLNLRDRLEFYGFTPQEQLLNELDQAEWYMNLSDLDPSPKALIEALACNCKVVISTGVGTHKDLAGLPHVSVINTKNLSEAIAHFQQSWDILTTLDDETLGLPGAISISKCVETIDAIQKGV